MSASKGPLTGLKIGVLGAGNMGQALIRGLVEKSVYPQNLTIFDPDKKKLDAVKKIARVRTSPSNRHAVSLADVVILAVKPQTLGGVLDEIAPATPGKLLISVAAGVSTGEIRRHVPPGTRLIRVMPNTPALVLEGATIVRVGTAIFGSRGG